MMAIQSVVNKAKLWNNKASIARTSFVALLHLARALSQNKIQGGLA